ncbi:MAG: DUF1826 domain-containing protein [Myxococcota bacterium]|nr:DUF1826 domain-containing protein [Myxococcota bacterium]
MLATQHRPTVSLRSEFAEILHADKNVVSIPRTLNPGVAMRLQRLADQIEFAHEAPLDLTDLDVSALLVSIPDEPERAFLEADIIDLAQQFGALLQCKHLYAHLYTQRTNACRKIHTDYVPLRLLCTYAGPGTEWMLNEDIGREHLGSSELGAKSANARLIRAGASLQQSKEGEVLLLKGETYHGNEGRGVAHRSPPIEALGVNRLVLKIDQEKCGC